MKTMQEYYNSLNLPISKLGPPPAKLQLIVPNPLLEYINPGPQVKYHVKKRRFRQQYHSAGRQSSYAEYLLNEGGSPAKSWRGG